MRRIVSIAAAIFACLFIVMMATAILSKNQKNERDKLESEMNQTHTTAATTTNFWDYYNSYATTTVPEDNSGLHEVTGEQSTTEQQRPAVTTAPVIDFIR